MTRVDSHHCPASRKMMGRSGWGVVLDPRAAKNVGVLLCWMGLWAVIVGGPGCNTYAEEADLLDPPLVNLRPVYDVRMEVVGSDCELGGFGIGGLDAVASVSQAGNTVSWIQEGISSIASTAGAQPWGLRGRVCAEGGGQVLRLRGGRIDRLEDGDGFCRADFRIPAAHAQCAWPTEAEEICADPASIALPMDPCTGELVTEFTSCIRFGESCSGQPTCTLRLRLVATPQGWPVDEACTGAPPSVETNACTTTCDSCACTL